MKKLQKGFTLVELLVVIGILAILTAVVLVAVNPGRQLQQARNTQRRADVNTILTAITAYMADPINKGELPAGLVNLCTATPHNISTADLVTDPNALDLGSLVAPRYVAAMPRDPSALVADLNTGYDVCVFDAAERRVTVLAPESLNDNEVTVISVTR